MTINMTFLLSDEQLADSLLKSIIERAGVGDTHSGDAWETKRTTTYLCATEVSKDSNVAILVNAYNILKFGIF